MCTWIAGGHRSASASPSQSAQGSPQQARSATTSPSQAFQPGPIPTSSGPRAQKQSPQLKWVTLMFLFLYLSQCSLNIPYFVKIDLFSTRTSVICLYLFNSLHLFTGYSINAFNYWSALCYICYICKENRKKPTAEIGMVAHLHTQYTGVSSYGGMCDNMLIVSTILFEYNQKIVLWV